MQNQPQNSPYPQPRQQYPQQQQYRQASQQPPQQYPQPQQRPAQPSVIQDIRTVHHVLDKKMILPIIIIILLLIAAIVLYSFMQSTEEETEELFQEQLEAEEPVQEEGSKTCLDMVNEGRYVDEDSCLAALALETFALDECNNIADIQKKEACIKGFADYFLDSDACLGLRAVESQAECIFGIAMKNEQLGSCFDMPVKDGEFSENHCIFELARRLGDKSLCGFIGASEEPYTPTKCLKAVEDSQGV